jgi:hypothetical protein
VGAGERAEGSIELPRCWVRAFLQLHGAMALPGTRIVARPVDLLVILRSLQLLKLKASPHALRYVFDPGAEVSAVLEPGHEPVHLKGTTNPFLEAAIIRTWHRDRLRLLEPLLPYAESVVIYLKGTAVPSFYAVHLKGITFLLGLTGWTRKSSDVVYGFDLLAGIEGHDENAAGQAMDRLRRFSALKEDVLARMVQVSSNDAASVMRGLCRQGKVLYDLERREYRLRELFEEGADQTEQFGPDSRCVAAHQWIQEGTVSVKECRPQDRHQVRQVRMLSSELLCEVIRRDWYVSGVVAGQTDVEVIVQDPGRIIFGLCSCPFFEQNGLNRGPCAHMLGLLQASASRRTAPPLSRALE